MDGVRGWRKLHNEELHNVNFPYYNKNGQVKEDEICKAILNTRGEKCL
jgi:hypothetical protein